eukprot:8998967-Ditylum_brightwellii.AAC.2
MAQGGQLWWTPKTASASCPATQCCGRCGTNGPLDPGFYLTAILLGHPGDKAARGGRDLPPEQGGGDAGQPHVHDRLRHHPCAPG